MLNCNIESILNTYRSVVRCDRALKVKLGQLKQTDPDENQYIKN